MGLMDRLKGSSGGAIQVDVEPTIAGPGSEMAVRFSVLDQLDDKARSVRAGVTCTGRYQVEERERDADGDEVSQTVWRDVEIFAHEQAVELRTGEQRATVFLPDHVQPTSGDIVTWEAWARVDREKGIDIVERMPFQVRVPIERVPATRQGDAADDGLTLSGIPTAIRHGEDLQGTLVIDVPEELTTRSVKVRLHRRVTFLAAPENNYDVYSGSLVHSAFFGSSSQITDDVQVAEVELGGKSTFQPGQRQELPFSIKVPGAGPTSAHLYAQVDWRVEAALDRRLRSDRTVESPIIVV